MLLLVTVPIFILSGCARIQQKSEPIANNVKVSDLPKSGQVKIIQSDIIVERPQANQVIESPVNIIGETVGGINQIYFQLLDAFDRVFASSTVEINGTGFQDYYSYFLKFNLPPSPYGKLEVFSLDRAGLKINVLTLPVSFKNYRPLKVTLFESRTGNKTNNCSQVYPLEREIPFAADLFKATVDELLKPLTQEETAQGFINNLPAADTALNKLIIKDATATVDFVYTPNNNIKFDRCRLNAIRAQISETIKTMAAVEQVIISVNDKP